MNTEELMTILKKKHNSVLAEIRSGEWDGNDLEQIRGFLNGIDWVIDQCVKEAQ